MQRRDFNKMMTIAPLGLGMTPFAHTSDKILENCTWSRIKPHPWKQGDKVALVAPGSPIKPEKFDNAVNNLENLGLVPVFTDTVFKKYGYLAGTDEERGADLMHHFENKDIKGIWCLRGGYGCTRILSSLDYDVIRRNPKILIGYSDITALLLAIYQKTGLVGYHGPVSISNIFTDFTQQQVNQILFGQAEARHDIPLISQTDLSYRQSPYTITPGKASGALIGGNLSLLVNLPRTAYAPSYEGKLVFIEDVGEKPYRIDRMLTYLLEATDLKHAKGIILGVFADCEPKEDDVSLILKETMIDRLASLDIPCFYGFTFGHVSDICTFPIGIKAEMDADTFSVRLLEKATR